MSTINKILGRWRSDPRIFENIAAWETIPAREPRFAPLPSELHPDLQTVLSRQGITSLYIHQAAAWNAIQHGKHIIIVTGTASGKTLCYTLPVLDRMLKDNSTRAIFLFPTKALAQDQYTGLKNLNRLGLDPEIPVGVYDGDTPTTHRPAIRNNARLLISNPDMLHTGILPHHTSWAEWFRNLKFIVIDEAHTYRGIFGSHVANVIRRLKRIAKFYGSNPQFILTSATIANPNEFAGKLIEENVFLVDEDGSGRGSKHFLIYNPPIINKDLGLRASVLQESVHLASELLDYQTQTIIFSRTRRSVEIILTYLQGQSLNNSSSQDTSDSAIRGYRSGYLPRQRREIEAGLRRGSVRAVVATSALELGIDIGSMDAAILVGYPGTIASTWQQAGRAGRGEQTSLSILVTSADPIDQFIAHHSEYFFKGTPERALVNPDQLLILLDHIRCAAFELPFQENDQFGLVAPDEVNDYLDFLQGEGVVHHSGQKYFWMADKYPAQGISLRTTSVGRVNLQVDSDGPPTILGQIDLNSARWMVHPEAIYLHEGQMYLVENLDLEQNIAYIKPGSWDYYTEPRLETQVQLLEKLDELPLIRSGLPQNENRLNANVATKNYGEIQVTTQVIGFRKIKWYTHENLGTGLVDLPPTELQTTGYWLALSEEVVQVLSEKGLWTNAPNDYGPEWKALRQRVRERDGFRCQSCGVLEAGREHDVHHKIPFRTFESYEQANQLHNLVTLCPSCHRRVETAVRMRSGLAGLAYVLGHLAPLFLMCDSGDIGVHSDPQSTLTDGQPTVVIYDQVPTGIGLSEKLYEINDELLQNSLELVSSCECSDGCPSCVGPAGENGSGGKRETIAILDALIHGW